jgi:hypothetical protein
MNNISRRISRFPQEYLTEIEQAYAKCQTIENIKQWFTGLEALSLSVEEGRASYRQVENLVFELKVMHLIKTAHPDYHVIYEPAGSQKNGKTCDLMVLSDRSYLIELKSFHPKSKWAAIPYEHITENNQLIMDGHSYHDHQAVRGHLIDETVETEEKMENYKGDYVTVMGVLLGFYLHLEDLRDFVTIYRTGRYRFDDPLGKMTLYNMKRGFKGNINEFWGFPFYQTSFDISTGSQAVKVSLIQGKDEGILL